MKLKYDSEFPRPSNAAWVWATISTALLGPLFSYFSLAGLLIAKNFSFGGWLIVWMLASIFGIVPPLLGSIFVATLFSGNWETLSRYQWPVWSVWGCIAGAMASGLFCVLALSSRKLEFLLFMLMNGATAGAIGILLFRAILISSSKKQLADTTQPNPH